MVRGKLQFFGFFAGMIAGALVGFLVALSLIFALVLLLRVVGFDGEQVSFSIQVHAIGGAIGGAILGGVLAFKGIGRWWESRWPS